MYYSDGHNILTNNSAMTKRLSRVTSKLMKTSTKHNVAVTDFLGHTRHFGFYV